MSGGCVVWRDGRLCDRREPAVGVDDSAFSEGRGCYTSVRIAGGRPVFAARHVRRLERGALALRLGRLDPARVHHALRDLARAAFADGEGVVRVQLSRDAGGTLHVTGIPRPLGDDPPAWTLVTAPIAHDGPVLAGGHKLTNRLVHALAADAAREAGADDALLYDRSRRLVEAARSNVVVVDRDGRLLTPPAGRGAVAGIALEVIRERLPELRERDLGAPDLRGARAVFCTNAVRGARPVSHVDGEAIGGDASAWQTRLDDALARD